MEAALSTTMHWVDDPKVMERTRALAENFAAPYNVVFWGVDEGGTMASAAERHGALSISSELGGYGRVSVDGVRVAERGLDNVLKWHGHDRRQARHLAARRRPHAAHGSARPEIVCVRAQRRTVRAAVSSRATRPRRESLPVTCTSSKSGPATRCRSSFASTGTSGWRRVPAGYARAMSWPWSCSPTRAVEVARRRPTPSPHSCLAFSAAPAALQTRKRTSTPSGA